MASISSVLSSSDTEDETQIESQSHQQNDNKENPKRFDIVGEHNFIKNGDFSIDDYNFPVMPSCFAPLINCDVPDNVLQAIDICFVVRKIADEIGKSIKSAFYLMPPTSVLNEISKKFKKDFSSVDLNFGRIKKLQPDNKKIAKFKDVEVRILIYASTLN
jgi:hypothetical protein